LVSKQNIYWKIRRQIFFFFLENDVSTEILDTVINDDRLHRMGINMRDALKIMCFIEKRKLLLVPSTSPMPLSPQPSTSSVSSSAVAVEEIQTSISAEDVKNFKSLVINHDSCITIKEKLIAEEGLTAAEHRLIVQASVAILMHKHGR
jgi:hypothetical protein